MLKEKKNKIKNKLKVENLNIESKNLLLKMLWKKKEF